MDDSEKHGDHCNCNACQHKREDAIESKKKEDMIASMKGREFEILIGKLDEIIAQLKSIEEGAAENSFSLEKHIDDMAFGEDK